MPCPEVKTEAWSSFFFLNPMKTNQPRHCLSLELWALELWENAFQIFGVSKLYICTRLATTTRNPCTSNPILLSCLSLPFFPPRTVSTFFSALFTCSEILPHFNHVQSSWFQNYELQRCVQFICFHLEHLITTCCKYYLLHVQWQTIIFFSFHHLATQWMNSVFSRHMVTIGDLRRISIVLMITTSQFHLLSCIFEQAAPPLWEYIHFEMIPVCMAKAWYDVNILPVNVLFCLNFFQTHCSQA